MGCGNSKLVPAEEVPVKIRPMLMRRFEELTKRKSKNGATLQHEGTLSKKKLLKDAAEEEDDKSHSSRGTETGVKAVKSTPKETEADREEKVVLVPVEKVSKVVPLADSESESEEEQEHSGSTDQEDKDKDRELEKVKHVDEKVIDADEKTSVTETEEGKTADNKHEEVHDKSDHEKDDDSGDDNDNEFGRFICPSPSFRIYCIEAQKNEEKESENEAKATIHQKSPGVDSFQSAAPPVKHHKKPSADSVVSTASKSSRDTNEGVEIESNTKSDVKHRKKWVLVKNLIKIKSCYYPSCGCAGYDRGRLVSAKAAH